MSTTVRVSRNDFPRMAARFGAALTEAVNTSVEALARAADAETPVATGALRSNKTIQQAGGGGYAASVTWNEPYAIYVHDGTSRMSGRPFAQHAAEAVQPGFVDALAGILGRI